VILKMRCPFTQCRQVIELEEDSPQDGDKIEEDCPGCERPLEITILVLHTGVMADCSPGSA
jgi:hypothetical protein